MQEEEEEEEGLGTGGPCVCVCVLFWGSGGGTYMFGGLVGRGLAGLMVMHPDGLERSLV